MIKKMSRLPRVTVIGVPVHIIERDNNHQVCFDSEEGMMVVIVKCI